MDLEHCYTLLTCKTYIWYTLLKATRLELENADHWKTSFEPDRNKTKLVKTFFVSLSTFPAITSSGLWLGENKWETKKRRNQSGLFLTDFPMLKKTLHAIWWGKWYYSVLLQPFFHAVSVRTVIKKLPASSSCCLYEFWKAMSENEM